MIEIESLEDNEKIIAILVSRLRGNTRASILSAANKKMTTREAIKAFRDLHQKGLIYRKPSSSVWESIIEVPKHLRLPEDK